jgi:hypothetical protein
MGEKDNAPPAIVLGLGAVAGAGAGLVGGLIYDHVKKNEQSAYQQGYNAGKTSN